MAAIQPPVSWEAVLDFVSNILGVPVAVMDPRWPNICVRSTQEGWVEVYQRWILTGYGAANAQGADQNYQLTLNESTIIALRYGSTFSQYSDAQLEQIAKLKTLSETMAVTIGGQPIAPAANESPVGGVSFGINLAAQSDACQFDAFSNNPFGGSWFGGPRNW